MTLVERAAAAHSFTASRSVSVEPRLERVDY